MDQEETFSIVRTSPCNKYARDGRPQSHLWRDVHKAWSTQQRLNVISGGFRPLSMPRLVDEPASETFIDLYRDWAVESTDAVPQFHDLAAFILLSSIVSNSVKLYASHGPIVPNLWGLVLGDSTLARKTTAMRLTTDLINAIDPGLILATDGSAE